MADFLRETVLSKTITARKLITAFGIRPVIELFQIAFLQGEHEFIALLGERIAYNVSIAP